MQKSNATNQQNIGVVYEKKKCKKIEILFIVAHSLFSSSLKCSFRVMQLKFYYCLTKIDIIRKNCRWKLSWKLLSFVIEEYKKHGHFCV